MKKIVYLLTVFSLVFASCAPLDEVYDELDAQAQETPIIGDATIILTEDDYKNEVKDGGLELANSYFENQDEAKEKLPPFIKNLYPVWGEGSSVVVNYNLNSPVSKTAYTVTDADYTAVGLSSLESDDDFNALLDYKFSGSEKGSVVDLTYKTSPEITSYELTDEDYDLVGNGRFDNFDIRPGSPDETEEARRVKIQTILLNNFPAAVLGDKYEVTYDVFDGSAGTLTMLVELTENVPANVTNYTLTNDDYALVGNGRFNNFDIRPGKPEETIEARRAKIETILLNNFTTAQAGDIYNVTYAIWNNAPGTREMLLEFDGTNWNIYKALTYEFYTLTLIDKTSRFVFVDKWEAPFVLMTEDYRAMGQQYDNFNGRDAEQIADAQRIIGIYLGQKYPFAAADDFMALQYDSYAGGGVTNTLNVNYVHDGTKWNAIPEVIATSLQFGFEDGMWVPDNTIKYTLTNADYALVGNDRFNNFDVRPGKPEEKVEDRLAKINTILLNNFPQYGEGQKFLVSYAVWKPGDDVFVMSVIHNGTEYVLK